MNYKEFLVCQTAISVFHVSCFVSDSFIVWKQKSDILQYWHNLNTQDFVNEVFLTSHKYININDVTIPEWKFISKMCNGAIISVNWLVKKVLNS